VKEGTSNSVPPALEYRLARESDMPEPERFEITAGEQLLMPCGSTVVFPETGELTAEEVAAIIAAQSRCTVKVVDAGNLEIIPPDVLPLMNKRVGGMESALASLGIPAEMTRGGESYAAARAALEAAAPKPYPEPRNRREKRKAAAEARRRR